jgi:hypothetical protein
MIENKKDNGAVEASDKEVAKGRLVIRVSSALKAGLLAAETCTCKCNCHSSCNCHSGGSKLQA